MSIVQMYIAADEAYDVANKILCHDLPKLETCDESDREAFVKECRWAIGEKVRQVALMHAFRETMNGDMQTLEELCLTARTKILDPSFMLSVQEFVLLDLGVRENLELHPHLRTVMQDTRSEYRKIIQALGQNVAKVLTPKEIEKPTSIGGTDLKPFDKGNELGDGNSLSA